MASQESLVQALVQIQPTRIHLKDEPDFPDPVPFLDLPLAAKGPSRVSWTSYQTNTMTPYLAVKPGKAFSLCCQMRFESASV